MELPGESAAPSPEFSVGLAVSARQAALLGSRLEGAPKDSEPVCLGLDLGFRDYEESLRIQDRIVARRKCGFLPDCLLFVDYPPIITLGRGGKREHLWRPRRNFASGACEFTLPVVAEISPTTVPDNWWSTLSWI